MEDWLETAINKTTIYKVLGIVIYLAIIILTDYLVSNRWPCYIIWSVCTVIGLVLVTWKKKTSLDSLKQDILAKLKEAGYDCNIDRGVIVIRRKNTLWFVLLRESGCPNLFHVKFSAYFDGGDKPLTEEGSAMLLRSANHKFNNTKLSEHSDKDYTCEYDASIRSAEDFMIVFANAWNEILETVRWISDNWNNAMKLYPPKGEKHEIGFKQ